jgi:hypothetical protein
MNDSFLYSQPAWLIGLAIIGAVLSLYLVACFVSIGFSMADVSSFAFFEFIYLKLVCFCVCSAAVFTKETN